MSLDSIIAGLSKRITEVKGSVPSYEWATVASVSPVTVVMDSDATETPIPVADVQVANLAVDDRVEVRSIGSRRDVVAPANGINGTADLVDGISLARVFNNVVTYNSGASTTTNPIIIETPIQFSTYKMFKFRFTGFNYVNGRTDIDFTVTGYTYSPSSLFVRIGVSHRGTCRPGVRLGVNAAGYVCVIIAGDPRDGGNFAYPQLLLTEALIGFTDTNATYKDGWTARDNIAEGSLASTYSPLTTAPDYSQGAFQTFAPAVSGWTLGNGTITGRYSRVGNTVTFTWVLTVGSTTVIGSLLQVSLPFSVGSAMPTTPGTVRLTWSGNGYYDAFGWASGAYFNSYAKSATSLADIGYAATTPFDWSTGGNSLTGTVVYECAP